MSDFEIFWNKYPNKEAKKKAKEIWLRAKPDLNEILKALEWQLVSDKWKRGFIPLPATYLNQERWNDLPAIALTQEDSERAKLKAELL